MARWLMFTQFFVVLLFVGVFADQDHYEVLGVKRTATKSEIRQRYRNLARTHHPDQNKNDPKAEEKFRKITAAYEVLNDDERRRRYDTSGTDEKQFDFFSSFGMQEPTQRVVNGDDVVMDLWVTLEELCVGEFVEIQRVRLEKKHSKGTRKCRCRREMRTTQISPQQFQMHQVEVCDDCPNIEFYEVERPLEVEIEPGMRDGQLYPFSSEGESHADGESGDLKFRLKQQKHRYFQRRGDDLYTNITLSLAQSLAGYHISLKHLDGHQVILHSDMVTAPGTVIRKVNEGMPNYENPRVRGSLYVTFDVAYPTGRQLTETERSEVLQLFPDPVLGNATHSDEPVAAVIYNGLDVGLRYRTKVTA